MVYVQDPTLGLIGLVFLSVWLVLWVAVLSWLSGTTLARAEKMAGYAAWSVLGFIAISIAAKLSMFSSVR